MIRDTIHDACDANLNDKVSSRLQKLAAFLKDGPSSTLNEFAAKLGASPTTTHRDLAYLQKPGIVRREGSRENRYLGG